MAQQPAFNPGGFAQRKMLDLPWNVAEAVRRMPVSSSRGQGISLARLLTPEERAHERLRKIEVAEAKLRERRA